MSHKKQRVFQHIMENTSLQIIRNILPSEWVIRDYKPDYGIDISVEIFEYIDDSNSIAETLGEWFFAQVKSVKTTQIKTIKVHSRGNVEKSPLTQYKNELLEIEVIPFKIDTNELLTIQAMGAGVPVLLLLATLDTNCLYFVCLNDLLDKCIIPSDEEFFNKKTKTIYIPVKNKITDNNRSLIPIKFLAKRPKLYAAFSKFSYQQNEVFYIFDKFEHLSIESISKSSELNMLIHFIGIIKRYDFWETSDMWLLIRSIFNKILKIEIILKSIKEHGVLPKELLICEHEWLAEPERIEQFGENALLLFIVRCELDSTWKSLITLNGMYEETCREWFLPTYLAERLSSSGRVE
jgi:hypothetical protein